MLSRGAIVPLERTNRSLVFSRKGASDERSWGGYLSYIRSYPQVSISTSEQFVSSMVVVVVFICSTWDVFF